MPAVERSFPVRIDDRYRLLVRICFGATPERAWVRLSDRDLAARFGWFELRIALAEIVGWRIEGPWRAITAIGVRRAIRGAEVSFSGSPRGGVRLDFREPVRWTIFDVPALYVGVQDLEGFAAALTAAGIPGVDARGGPVS